MLFVKAWMRQQEKDPSSLMSQELMVRAQPGLGEEVGNSSQDPVPRLKELLSGLLGWDQVRPGHEALPGIVQACPQATTMAMPGTT